MICKWIDCRQFYFKMNLLCLYTIIAIVCTQFNDFKGCPRGVMVKAMDCGIVVSEFVFQSRYYVHFRANILEKSMNPLILPVALLFFLENGFGIK